MLKLHFLSDNGFALVGSKRFRRANRLVSIIIKKGQHLQFTMVSEKATSELLPANQTDLALQFTISDQIRSKAVNARDAMRAFKRRLEHKNPNVQLLTLSVSPFLFEVLREVLTEPLRSFSTRV